MVDTFDKMMTSVGDILEYQAGDGDDYGRRPKANYTTFMAGVACRVSIITTRGTQTLQERGQTTIIRKAYMRPQAQPITDEQFLRVSGIIYRITQVDNPGLLNHHLELWLTEIEK